MKLLTKEIEEKIPKIYTYESNKPKDVPVKLRFFCPWNNWTWYVTEGERIEDGDFKFFGWVVGHYPEMGYFLLSELESVKGPFGLEIERDIYFSERTLKEIMNLCC